MVAEKLTNLWYFWDGPSIPPICNLGIKTLLHNAIGFDVYALNTSNIKDYLPELDCRWNGIKKWAHKTDYIKPRILYKYGGIFVDVDVVCLEDLNILTDTLNKSDCSFMLDALGSKDNLFFSISLLVSKPHSYTAKKFLDLQDEYLFRTKFKIDKWHDIGGLQLNKCKSKDVLAIRYQRATPVSDSVKTYLCRKNWSLFVRKTKGVPKPVIWPISYSSYFCKAPNICSISEEQWLNGRYMISSAFRHGLQLDSPIKFM